MCCTHENFTHTPKAVRAMPRGRGHGACVVGGVRLCSGTDRHPFAPPFGGEKTTERCLLHPL